MALAPLDGFVIAVTADRRAEEQAELLRRRGAAVSFAPTIATEYLASDEDVRAATEATIAACPEYVVVLTGIGLRAWIEASQSWGLDRGLLATLRSAKVLARGPKASAAASAAGIPVWRCAATEQTGELVEILRGEAPPGATVVLQRHGGTEARFASTLRNQNVTVLEVPVYRWRLPNDHDNVRGLIQEIADRRVHAVTFTSAPAVQNLFAVADELDAVTALRDAFNGGVAAGCVGPVCAAVARDLGVVDPVYPEVGRLGLMIRALTAQLVATRFTGVLGGTAIELQGRVACVDGARVELTPREVDVLRELLAARGAVVAAPESVVRRLRRKLGTAGGGVETVRRRGYRLALS